MKKTLFILTLLLVTLSISAVPARKKPFVHMQSDGTKISLVLEGDEHLHYYVNTDTNEKMLPGENGDFYVVSEDEMTALVKAGTERSKEANANRIARLERHRGAQLTDGPHRDLDQFGDMIGSKKGLVILVNFSDKSMHANHTQSTFDDQFNKEGYNLGGHIGSVHDYFYDQSYGLFDLTFDVVGPVTLSKTLNYYGKNSGGNDSHPGEMVIEALKLIDDEVDFNDYDWDGNGEVDQVYVIYAGYGEHAGASSNTIWPHEWQLSSAHYYGDGDGAQYLDGVRIDTYACSCELSGSSGSTLNGIGTACHEFSHCLGYPDLYDTDYSGGLGMDYFDVMCSGSYNGPDRWGEVPSGYTAYERWMAGWVSPVELGENGATITNMEPLNDEPVAYIMYNQGNRNEYFLLENRQSNRWFGYYGSSQAGHGLFITHIDYNSSVWQSNKPNDSPSHQRVSWIAADGSKGSSPKGDYFPGTSNVRSLTNNSHKNAGAKLFNKNTDGSYCMNHELTEISESNGQISFLFDGGYQDSGARYTVVYNAGTGACDTISWTQAEFMEEAVLPAVVSPAEEWNFAGWSTKEYKDEVTELTSELLTAGTTYKIKEDAILYAVYNRIDSVEIADSIAKEEIKYYHTYPVGAELVVPTVSFANETITTHVGDEPVENVAKVDGSEGVVVYTTSNSLVAQVDATTGAITPIGVGDAIISATVSALPGIARSAYNSNTVTVGMPELKSIDVTAFPDKMTYWEGEKFLKNGIVVAATYKNDYVREVTEYTYEPNKNKELELADTIVTVTYKEGDISVYTTFPITVQERPKYTVKFDPGTGTCEIESLKEEAYQAGVLLPEAKSISEDWTFIGWNTACVEDTIVRPSISLAGNTYKPKDNITLYAVYRHTDEDTPDVFQYTTQVIDGEEYIFASSKSEGTALAIDAAKLTSTITNFVDGAEVTITKLNDIATIETVDSTAIWTVSGSSEAMQLKNGENYLRLSTTGYSVVTTSKTLYWSSNYGLYGQGAASRSTYYVQPNDTAFTIKSSGNSSKRVYLYKKVDTKVYTYSTNPEDSSADIHEIMNSAANMDNRMYNLNGQQILLPKRGQIYIKNGRKYLQR